MIILTTIHTRKLEAPTLNIVVDCGNLRKSVAHILLRHGADAADSVYNTNSFAASTTLHTLSLDLVNRRDFSNPRGQWCDDDVDVDVDVDVVRRRALWPALMEVPPSPPPLHGHHWISLTPLPFPILCLSQRLNFSVAVFSKSSFSLDGLWGFW
ncbi:hypothetical protein GmHk_06G015267 [Glycine max]|nr:hypothetical protein GmHk_06G015267 [Glycine max]